MVPQNLGNVCRLPADNPGNTQPDLTEPPNSDTTHNLPTSRVDYLRRRYKEQQLLEETTELMLASWREKSAKAYDSQFQKWLSWYRLRGADPISCHVGEVVNFLAELFSQGYEYRSLNAFR